MDKKLIAISHNFQISDHVYVKSAPGNKSTPRFDPETYTILKIKGEIKVEFEDSLNPIQL